MAEELRERAERWLAEDPDPDTRAELAALLAAEDVPGLVERFDGRLQFGTAGLRGPLGAGPTRMNRAVVRRTAAGLAAYLKARDGSGPVLIGYDARYKSADFAADSAAVLAGAGLEARVLPGPLPTPVLAFAVRHLGARAGIMVTASHNPPQDNGYKVYLADGAQLVPPADNDIEEAIAAVGALADVPLSDSWTTLGEEVLAAYLSAVAAVPRTAFRDLTIASTALHGVGGPVLAAALEAAGFERPVEVAEQAAPDPDFPTVAFPNPEEPGATDLLLALADRVGADIAIANDPDADRCAVACGGRLLRGDEVGVLLADHLMRHGVHGSYVTTVVSSSLLGTLCAARGQGYAQTLTGFKWIVRGARDLVFGYEEALGYAVAPDLVRDKDGISAALLVADLAASLRVAGKTLLDRLDELAAEFGVYATDQLSVRAADPGVFAAAMARLRAEPPRTLLDRPLSAVEDLLPDSDVLVLRADRCRVVVRPSGTEPKLKAYLEVVVPVHAGQASGGSLDAARKQAADQLTTLREEVGRLL
jgi:phosphomannomutase